MTNEEERYYHMLSEEYFKQAGEVEELNCIVDRLNQAVAYVLSAYKEVDNDCTVKDILSGRVYLDPLSVTGLVKRH